jgi:hypothetical protein
MKRRLAEPELLADAQQPLPMTVKKGLDRANSSFSQ